MQLLAWIEATRPKTLMASIIPVIVANSIAYYYNSFNLKIALITLICAIFIQITTNYFNEVYDFLKGADTKDRIGPRRLVASGIIPAKTMMVVTICIAMLTFILGLVLVNYAGIYILLIGIISLFFAWAYTGGPYPLAYKGLGDIFVFVFFGLIAVNGAFYVQTQEINLVCFVASLAPGLLSANILSINNIRDIENDPKANKITLAVRIGKANAIKLYTYVNIFAYLSIFILHLITHNFYLLLPFLSLPLAIKLIRELKIKNGAELNPLLAQTGLLLFIFGVLTSLAFIISK